jgi:hypothetical protein
MGVLWCPASLHYYTVLFALCYIFLLMALVVDVAEDFARSVWLARWIPED